MSNTLRSRPNTKLCIFAGVGCLLSLGVILLFVFTDDPIVIKVVAWIFCGIFFIIGCVILWVQLFNWVEIKDDMFIAHKGLIKKKFKFNEISKVDSKDGLYDVVVNGKRVATLSPDDSHTQKILLFLEKKHVKIHWR